MTHTGRPLIRETKTHVLVLCPYGHLIHGIDKQDWAGSALEARAGDSAWKVECSGAIGTENRRIDPHGYSGLTALPEDRYRAAIRTGG